MSEEELIEVLRQFDEKRVEELPEKTRNILWLAKLTPDTVSNTKFELLNILNKGSENDVKKNNTNSN